MEDKRYTEARLIDKGGAIAEGKNARWYVQFYEWSNVDGKLIRKRLFDVNTYKTAEERYLFADNQIKAINDKLATKYSSQVVANGKPPKTLSDAFEICLAVKAITLRPKTYHNYEVVVHRFVKFTDAANIWDLTTGHFQAFHDHLIMTKVKAKTVNNCMGVLRSMLSLMVDKGWLEKMPYRIKKLKEEKSYQNKAFTLEEQQLVYPHIAQDKQLSLMVQLMYYCFLRPGESRLLQVRNISIKSSQIFVPATISKNKKAEYVTIPTVFVDFLTEWMLGKTADSYIVNGSKKPIGINTLAKRHRKILFAVGLEHEHTFYSWKHTGVVDAYRNGIDMKSLQLQCRHHDISMTDTYLNSLGLYLNKAMMNNMPSWNKNTTNK